MQEYFQIGVASVGWLWTKITLSSSLLDELGQGGKHLLGKGWRHGFSFVDGT